MKLGFIGTGIITTSVVTGFCESGMENLQIVVSPRNKERAQMLHEKYPEICVIQIALPDAYVEHGNVSVLREMLGINSDSVIRRIEKEFLNEKR